MVRVLDDQRCRRPASRSRRCGRRSSSGRCRARWGRVVRRVLALRRACRSRPCSSRSASRSARGPPRGCRPACRRPRPARGRRWPSSSPGSAPRQNSSITSRRVVLVRLPLVGVGAVQPQQHRRVVGDLLEQRREVAQRVACGAAGSGAACGACCPRRSCDVANRSWRLSVIRSTSWLRLRTMRSSHHRLSWPHSFERIDRRLSTVGVGAHQHVRRERVQQLLHRAGRAPCGRSGRSARLLAEKPARHSNRL